MATIQPVMSSSLSSETLLRDVWGYEPTLDTRTVDTTMQRLRAKLGQVAHHLETVRGVGYRLIDLNA